MFICVYICVCVQTQYVYVFYGINAIKYIMYSVLQIHYKIHVAPAFKELTFQVEYKASNSKYNRIRIRGKKYTKANVREAVAIKGKREIGKMFECSL